MTVESSGNNDKIGFECIKGWNQNFCDLRFELEACFLVKFTQLLLSVFEVSFLVDNSHVIQRHIYNLWKAAAIKSITWVKVVLHEVNRGEINVLRIILGEPWLE